MTDETKSRSVFSSIYAGLGFGLLIGLIMGLSISPTVKVVMGALASLLGGLFGLEDKLGKSQSQQSNMERNLKLGSFGFAVVAGIVFGINVRTHELFAPSIADKVQNWVDAGYDSVSARKYVLYEKLLIDPVTNETTANSDELLKKNISALFNSTEKKLISAQLDTVLFKGDIEVAKSSLSKLGNSPLNELMKAVGETIPTKDQMLFLSILQQMTYKAEIKEASYCELSSDTIDWSGVLSRKMADLLIGVDYQSRNVLVSKVKAYFCSLNQS